MLGLLYTGLTVVTGYLLIFTNRYENCTQKGYDPYICIGETTGLTSIKKFEEKDEYINILSIKIADAYQELDSLRKRMTEIEQNNRSTKPEIDEQIVLLTQQRERLRNTLTETQKAIAKFNAPPLTSKPATPTRTLPPSAVSRPSPRSYSNQIWPAGSISSGVVRSTDTPYGRLTCIGGNDMAGVPRDCRWDG